MPTSSVRPALALLLGVALSPLAAAAGEAPRDPTQTTPPSSLRFASPEHEFLASQVQLRLPDGRRVAGDQAPVLSVRNSAGPAPSVELSYAQIVYLGGDFYGVPYASIAGDTPFDVDDAQASPAETAARAALLRNLLAFAYRGYADYLPRIGELEQELMQRFREARSAGRPLPYSNADECEFMRATGADGCIRDASDLWNLRDYLGLYTELAARSNDHFHTDGQTAFLLGIKMALEQALDARGPQDLRFAYALAAYASHFGSDAFSAGHIRTNKRAINAYCAPQLARYGFTGWSELLLSGVLVKRMHDQDSTRGIVVTAANGQRWKAYGDLSLAVQDDQDNVRRAVDVLQLAVDRVYEAYAQRERIDRGSFIAATLHELRQRLPDTAATMADIADNGPPLFEAQGERMQWNDPELGSRELDCRQAVLRYIQDLGGDTAKRLQRRLDEPAAADLVQQAQRSIDVTVDLVDAPDARSLVCEWGKRQHGDFPSTQGAFSSQVSAHLESNGAGTGAEGDLYCLVLPPDRRDSECQFTVHFDNPFLGDDRQSVTSQEGSCTIEVDEQGRGNNWRPRIQVRASAQQARP